MIKLKDSERTKCEVWSRVMGYHRPVTSWNQGKQQEQKDRTHFTESSIKPGDIRPMEYDKEPVYGN